MRYKVISFGGQINVVPPVPNLTDMIPSFFRELMIFRIVTGLIPADSDKRSLFSMTEVSAYVMIIS